eukprot:2040075-Prymnesium_polylepis.1
MSARFGGRSGPYLEVHPSMRGKQPHRPRPPPRPSESPARGIEHPVTSARVPSRVEYRKAHRRRGMCRAMPTRRGTWSRPLAWAVIPARRKG